MEYTKENAAILADLKNKAQNRALELAPAVIKALAAFDGKSITGNRKRITDAIKAIDLALYVNIESNPFLGVKIDISYFERNRSVKIGDSWQYIDGTIPLLEYHYNKENILIFADAEKAIFSACERLRERIKKAAYTAENIEIIRKKQKELCQELNDLLRDCDSEIGERFGINFTYYR
jgi:hypothetical protein